MRLQLSALPAFVAERGKFAGPNGLEGKALNQRTIEGSVNSDTHAHSLN